MCEEQILKVSESKGSEMFNFVNRCSFSHRSITRRIGRIVQIHAHWTLTQMTAIYCSKFQSICTGVSTFIGALRQKNTKSPPSKYKKGSSSI